MIFGKKIRELRDEQGVLQRQLAALLEIDTPMFSKIERGDRRAKREHVIKLAEYLHQDEKEMLTHCCTRTDSKVITPERQVDVLTTANCRSVVKRFHFSILNINCQRCYSLGTLWFQCIKRLLVTY